jgi:hypothetical protein
MTVTTNREGLTYGEWLSAATLGRLDATVAKRAWKAGEDPSEYAAKIRKRPAAAPPTASSASSKCTCGHSAREHEGGAGACGHLRGSTFCACQKFASAASGSTMRAAGRNRSSRSSSSTPRFRFTYDDGRAVVGVVQGSGGRVRAIARLRSAIRQAKKGQDTGLYEPAPGHVAVYPHSTASEDGPQVNVDLCRVRSVSEV